MYGRISSMDLNVSILIEDNFVCDKRLNWTMRVTYISFRYGHRPRWRLRVDFTNSSSSCFCDSFLLHVTFCHIDNEVAKTDLLDLSILKGKVALNSKMRTCRRDIPPPTLQQAWIPVTVHKHPMSCRIRITKYIMHHTQLIELTLKSLPSTVMQSLSITATAGAHKFRWYHPWLLKLKKYLPFG